MFGYVTADRGNLKEAERQRYDSCYCGLCRVLSRKTGLLTAVCLNYDMTFLLLLLQSLYEPEETAGFQRCLRHPVKKRPYVTSRFTDYCADMTVLLSYEKCMDDWRDEKNLLALLAATFLKRGARRSARRYPRQAEVISRQLKILYAAEGDLHSGAEDAANAFGALMACLFCIKEDRWRGQLQAFGTELGKFVYFMDAACDMEKDIRTGSYNACARMGMTKTADAAVPLQMLMGQACQVFEQLPLVQDMGILRNVLYSGVWAGYGRAVSAQKGEDHA